MHFLIRTLDKIIYHTCKQFWLFQKALQNTMFSHPSPAMYNSASISFFFTFHFCDQCVEYKTVESMQTKQYFINRVNGNILHS